MTVTVNQLRAKLDRIVEKDSEQGAALVVAGPVAAPVEGGLARGGQLWLAPIPMNEVGGF